MSKKEVRLHPIQLSPKQLETVLGLGKTKINELMNSGRLPSYQIDGSRFVHSKDVWEFVNRFRIEQNPHLDIKL